MLSVFGDIAARFEENIKDIGFEGNVGRRLGKEFVDCSREYFVVVFGVLFNRGDKFEVRVLLCSFPLTLN